jgi:large subunit ribosomal protein L33
MSASKIIERKLDLIPRSSVLGAKGDQYMSQDNLIKFECTECKNLNYHSSKNKKTLKTRLELKKFCKKCKKHVLHKETK